MKKGKKAAIIIIAVIAAVVLVVSSILLVRELVAFTPFMPATRERHLHRR